MASVTGTDRMHCLSAKEIQLIHDASMEILKTQGICFNSPKATQILVQKGFKTSGNRVLIREQDVTDALQTVPKHFTIHAGNPDNEVCVGRDGFVLLPTVGAPNIARINGDYRPATLADFNRCCRLVQTSSQLDMGGWLMVQPNDVPLETAHLDMLFAYLTQCDKPLLGAFGSETMARDTFDMAELIFGSRDFLHTHPVTAMIVNALTPLQFSQEQTEVLILSSQYRQPVVISNMALAGSTAPVRLPGLLALINAEILAGMVLSQVVGPGTPVVYGTTSAPMDMKTSVGVLGAWETMKIAAAAIQMAGLYQLPCRTGGSLSDAHLPDAQAMAEGSLLLSAAIRNGAHFILHACGQLGSFMALSFEKWLMDEEVCALIKGSLSPLTVTRETIDTPTICDVGAGGEYLTHPSTFAHFKSLSRSGVFNRKNHQAWRASPTKDAAEHASSMLKKRLDTYALPPVDQGLKQELAAFVARRKSARA